MVEDFESILFRYLTNGIKIKHFKNKDDMVESIKNDLSFGKQLSTEV